MMEFRIDDMSCGHCVGMVTRTIKALDPQATVDIDLAKKTVKVESRADRAGLSEALAEAGYPPAPAEPG